MVLYWFEKKNKKKPNKNHIYKVFKIWKSVLKWKELKEIS